VTDGEWQEEYRKEWGRVCGCAKDGVGKGVVFETTVFYSEQALLPHDMPVEVQVRMMGQDDFESRMEMVARLRDWGWGYEYIFEFVDGGDDKPSEDWYGVTKMLLSFVEASWE